MGRRKMSLVVVVQPDEYEKLGSYALIGLPDEEYPVRYGVALVVALSCSIDKPFLCCFRQHK